ncbi:unnamed protein product [Clavelina lepadiformis]|uniref:Uncharacterized protein n=1 Tax=Clavelina lepadiformis TaxID=159417 RepID=A0ABP0GFG5_CLALP
MQNEIGIILCQHQVVSNVDPDLFNHAASSTLSFLVMCPYTVRLTSAITGQLKAKHPRSAKKCLKQVNVCQSNTGGYDVLTGNKRGQIWPRLD